MQRKGEWTRKSRTVRVALWVVTVMTWTALHTSSAQATEAPRFGSVVELVRYLEGRPASEREAILVEGARREGTVNFYTSMNENDLAALQWAFQGRYPFITVTAFRSGSGAVADRMLLEARAGRHSWDVGTLSSDFLFALIQADLLAPYSSPVLDVYPNALIGADGKWVGGQTQPHPLAWNTNMVNEADLPLSYWDLTDPKWRGNFSIDTEDYGFLYWMLRTKGEEEGLRLARALAANSPHVVRGRSTQTELIAAGEFAIGASMHEHTIVRYVERGAPIDWTYIEEPVLVSLEGFFVAKNAPNPYAAVLLQDWLLGPEGQQVMADSGRIVAYPGVRYSSEKAGRVLQERKLFTLDPVDFGQQAERIVRLYNEIFIFGL